MLRLRFWWVVLALNGAAGWAQPPAPRAWKLPPLDGEFSGEFKPLRDPSAPSLHWVVNVRTEKPRERAVNVVATGPGLTLRAEALLDPAGEGTWRLTDCEVALGPWWAAVAANLGPDLAGMAIAGTLKIEAEGTWRAGALSGHASVSVQDGRVDDPAYKLMFDGIAAALQIEDLATWRSAPAQRITWKSGRYDTFEIGAGQAVFELAGDEVRVLDAQVALLGGELTIGSVALSTKRNDLAVTAQVRGVDIAQLLFLLPPVLSDARGRLDGRLSFRRDQAGIQIGTGRLSLRQGETAELRLAPTPGLLSSSLPAAVLQHYPGLGKIEMGEVPLRADLLEVTFTPEGDGEGRSAWVHVAGGPVDPKLQAPVDLNVNVRGPLESLVKFGTNSRLRFGGPNK